MLSSPFARTATATATPKAVAAGYHGASLDGGTGGGRLFFAALSSEHERKRWQHICMCGIRIPEGGEIQLPCSRSSSQLSLSPNVVLAHTPTMQQWVSWIEVLVERFIGWVAWMFFHQLSCCYAVLCCACCGFFTATTTKASTTLSKSRLRARSEEYQKRQSW